MQRKADRRMVARYWANMRKNERNREYYYAHKREILRRYRNKYIAISNEKIVDADADRIKLLDRVFDKLGDQPFFYTQVTDQPRVVRIPSHAVVRKARIPS